MLACICSGLLGLFEGRLLGGMAVYLAMFYQRHPMLVCSRNFLDGWMIAETEQGCD
jgi:hypothetical protein